MEYWVHHLNDYSGSPLVMAQRMNSKSLIDHITLVTNSGNGFLSGWTGPKVELPYQKSHNRFVRFIRLSYWYLACIWYLWKHVHHGDKIVISTIINTPVLLIRCFVGGLNAEIHIHEVYFRVPLWNSLGLRLANHKDVHTIYNSRFSMDFWSFKGSGEVAYPRLRNFFNQQAVINTVPNFDMNRLKIFTVLSLIPYKGYRLFLELATSCLRLRPGYEFTLYVAGIPAEFYAEYPIHKLPPNLKLHFNNTDPEIYLDQHIFLGLTNPSILLEAFGQTIAEAMCTGNIVIASGQGGYLEFMENEHNAILLEEYSVQGILRAIDSLDLTRAIAISQKAKQRMCEFYSL